ncbi:hypothetical protein BDV96DRAFT_534219 [Lophiotrema nucula]|uniref:Ketoreductase domain-containing protein n=1 Tax=Lophiotrema nucula TaxID=690887 RepID=A0A6A5YIR4_9PLEO|nr:hypothetical protein BDV96DRAFT_534219 [Lophiotrema nucula]
MSSKTWLITGCSSGFGYELALAVMKRGDIAIATARGDPSRLQTLKDAGAHVYSLDVTAPLSVIKATVEKIVKDTADGRIDVLVNNAGYLEGGLIEEASEESWKRQFDTNFFGTLKTTQAVLPYMRSQKSGTILTIGSVAGWQSYPAGGQYASSKFALEGFHESLMQEAAPFGIKSLLLEPGMFRTKVLSETNLRWDKSATIPELDDLRTAIQNYASSQDGTQAGDTNKLVKIIIDVVNGEGVAKGRELVDGRLPLGGDALATIRSKCQNTLNMLDEWEDVIGSTNFDDVKGVTEIGDGMKMKQAELESVKA